MTPAILYPGDVVHLMLPGTGNEYEDNQMLVALREAYNVLGVNLYIATATTAPGAYGVVAIFRKEEVEVKEEIEEEETE